MYCIVECRKGVSINNIKPITEYPIYYIISKKEVDRAIEEYFKDIPQLSSKAGWDYVKEKLIEGKVGFTFKQVKIVINKYNKNDRNKVR